MSVAHLGDAPYHWPMAITREERDEQGRQLRTTTPRRSHGEWVPSPTRTATAFKGAVLQNRNSGYGFFLGTNASGGVRIESVP